MNLKEELIKIVGAEAVLDDPEALRPYTVGHSLWQTPWPNILLVFPGTWKKRRR